MGFRFRKSIKLFPGIRVNLSKKGVSSVSIGPSGAKLNVGENGSRVTVGIPGTGISYSEKISATSDVDAQRPEPFASSIERPAEPTSSIGIERLKTFLIIAMGLVIVAILMR